MVTSMFRVPLRNSPLLVSAMATTSCVLASRMRPVTAALPESEREIEYRHLGLRVLRREQVQLGDVVLGRHGAFDVELVGHDVAVLGQLGKIHGHPRIDRLAVAHDGAQAPHRIAWVGEGGATLRVASFSGTGVSGTVSPPAASVAAAPLPRMSATNAVAPAAARTLRRSSAISPPRCYRVEAHQAR